MRKSSLLLYFIACISCPSIAQNISVNQNQQNVNINLPVIEKKVYIDRYRTVYVEKPRVAKKLSAPIQLLGYLWVYPEDLGNFNQVPSNVLYNVNSRSPYGRNNWRIPTPDELAILEANADKVGLGSDIYLSTDHRNGVLRLVSTGTSEADNRLAESRGEVVNIEGTLWATKNHGASSKTDKGYEIQRANIGNFNFPQGWRLPTESEFRQLILGNAKLMQNGENFISIINIGSKNLSLFIDGHRTSYGAQVTSSTAYYITNNNGYIVMINADPVLGKMKDYGEILSNWSSGYVRLVKE